MAKKKSYPYTGLWLVVDEKNKKVKYQADPAWLKNTSDEEQKTTLAKLTALANVYRRAGFAIIDFIINRRKKH